ncbi:hypothetical protein ACQ4PT_042846 [Festuca glaucescens]
MHEACIRAQPTTDIVAVSSAVPPDAMLKSVLAEQAKLLRAELQGLATFQLEELVKPVPDVSESLWGFLERLGSMLERAAVALEGLSLAPACVQASPMQHALAAASPPLAEVGFAAMPNQLEMVVDLAMPSALEELKEFGAPCSEENSMKEIIEVDDPRELVVEPDVPSTLEELKDPGAPCTKKSTKEMNQLDAEEPLERDTPSPWGEFLEELAPSPLLETVALVEDIVVEYVTDLVHKAQNVASKRGKLLTEDFLYLIRKDMRKLHRATELLSMNEELKQARKAVDVNEEMLVITNE